MQKKLLDFLLYLKWLLGSQSSRNCYLVWPTQREKVLRKTRTGRVQIQELACFCLPMYYSSHVIFKRHSAIQSIYGIKVIGKWLCLSSEKEVLCKRITLRNQAWGHRNLREFFRDVRKLALHHTSLSIMFSMYHLLRKVYMYT